jgi:putative membrane protein
MRRFSPYFPYILLLFHVIGLVLFIRSESASDLTWMNLTLCGLLVFLAEENWKKNILTFLIIFSGGFLIELIGTKTGYLFGNYQYGNVLGFKLFDVSLIIGVNWFAIVLASSNLVRKVNVPLIFQAFLAALLAVLLDFVIEPIAVKYGFWTWKNDIIPLYNYVTWFVFAFIFSWIYLKNSIAVNKTAVWLYFIWLAFFIILSFV